MLSCYTVRYHIYTISFFIYYFSLVLVVHVDNSGPLLAVDVNNSESFDILTSMLNGTVSSPFSRFTAKELDAFGILEG